ncbi:MAG: BrnA antitoxin family protein [Magnetococcales bacterium]|nr:BrnA antitoxin family protein [Magnetococcales bacterium]
MNVKRTSLNSETDWAALDAMTDDDVDTSDIPPIPPELFAKALVKRGLAPIQAKRQITLRLDADVLDWFRGMGHGYQTQINAILKAYKQAHKPG